MWSVPLRVFYIQLYLSLQEHYSFSVTHNSFLPWTPKPISIPSTQGKTHTLGYILAGGNMVKCMRHLTVPHRKRGLPVPDLFLRTLRVGNKDL